jgi:hypothetical protein
MYDLPDFSALVPLAIIGVISSLVLFILGFIWCLNHLGWLATGLIVVALIVGFYIGSLTRGN